MRGATGRYWAHNMGFDDFNPRSPCGERHHYVNGKSSPNEISTHAPHAGSDVPFRCSYHWYLLFQPTLPMRGATGLMRHLRACREFQPTLPMRGATILASTRSSGSSISTHAPHAGSDLPGTEHHLYRYISTHAPHAGSDLQLTDMSLVEQEFQPTLPMRGATQFYRAIRCSC